VALPWCPLEGATGAAPAWAATPAPVARATFTKDMPVKASRQDSGPQRKPSQPQKPASNALATALCAVAVGTSGCTGAQVRPSPEACPDGSLEAMKRLGIRVGDEIDVHFPYEFIEDRSRSFVRPGKGTFEFSYELPGPGLKRRAGMLSGELILGSERVYGRFTQARLGDGPWFPVCIQLYTRANFDRKRGGGFVEGGPGVFREAWKGRADTAMIFPTGSAQAVDHFD
jgi:serine/threonine-protein kinase